MVLNAVANELARISVDGQEKNFLDAIISSTITTAADETLTKFAIMLHRCKTKNLLPAEILDIVSH